MEIVDYLKVARRRLWILMVVPLLAAGGVLAYHFAAPSTYQASAYVFIPDVVSGSNSAYSGAGGAGNWVSAFSATATSPIVTRPVAERVGLPTKKIADGLTVTQIGQSSQLEVQFAGTSPVVARDVVSDVATRTPKALFAPQLEQADKAVSRAQHSLQAINTELLANATASGTAAPVQLYSSELDLLARLRDQRSAARSAGHSSAAAAARAKIAITKAQVATLETQVATYKSLTAQRRAATGVLATAQQDLQSVRSQYAAAVAPHTVTMLPVTSVGLGVVLLKGVLPAMIAALLVAFCLVAALELLAGNRGRPGGAEQDPANRPRPPARRTSALRPFPVSSNYRGEPSFRPRLPRSPLGPLPQRSPANGGPSRAGPATRR
ncbi:MAG TPA: Wzz/FepE/Etk N-terminal domain-containing protein [Nocardioidaceae bacterium]|nr:Wzz/FepE/Etk N-terminal domain-containing protein [Nocardioidaceae bacterium]